MYHRALGLLSRRLWSRSFRPLRLAVGLAAVMAVMAPLASNAALAADDAFRPDEVKQAPEGAGGETYEPVRPDEGSTGNRARRGDPGGYGEPYSGPSDSGPSESPRAERYEAVPPADQGGPAEANSRFYSQSEITKAGHGFFGNVSKGLADAVEWAFQKAGRPNGYILGEDAGGALIAGLRYGEGTLHTKDAGNHRVFWQGPTIGYDVGAEGSKVLVLVYNLRDPSDIYNRFGGVQGAAYLVGGVGVQLQKSGDVTLAPIRSGLGVRLGANVGYLKYTRTPTWNPF
ncbi:MAG: EipA family protein [Hyphomicrobium sp.]